MIRVECGVQDISLYTHAWRPSKATCPHQTRERFAYPVQLLSASFLFRRSRCSRQLRGGTVDFILSLLVNEPMSKADEFIRTVTFVLLWASLSILQNYPY